jgi:hypothetical protein
MSPFTLQVGANTINLHAVSITIFFAVLFVLLYRAQKDGTLDWRDAITNVEGRVSSTKLMQLIGGMTATWVIIKLTLNNNLSFDLFALYLCYVAGINMFRRFVGAKFPGSLGSAGSGVDSSGSSMVHGSDKS